VSKRIISGTINRRHGKNVLPKILWIELLESLYIKRIFQNISIRGCDLWGWKAGGDHM